jgi:MarR family transcriptional regulator, transcriptional regulator for hemolysin
MLRYEFEETVAHWVCTTHHSVMVALRDELAPHNITPRQTDILGWLALSGPISQAELANRMMIEPPSLVGTLDRMEACGLLERKVCADDRRKNMIHPLPAAEKVWKQIADCGAQIQAQATEGMTEKELATLKHLLKKVRGNFEVLEILETAS